MVLTDAARDAWAAAGEPPADVVVIDDERAMCDGCRQVLEAEGLRALTAPDGSRGLALVERARPHVVIVDLKMPGMSGTDVVARLSELDPSIVSIVITGYASVDSAVESMKIGALDFLTKPFEPEQLIQSVRRGMELSEARARVREAPPAAPPAEEGLADASQVALRGLEVLGQYYRLGLRRRDFVDELGRLEAEARFHAETLGRIKEKEQVLVEVIEDLRVADEVIASHAYRKSHLLQVLLDVQARLNWLPRHVLKWISRRLKVPLASVYTVGSFYEALNLEPRGQHLVELCTGTACHVRGAPRLQAMVSSLLGIEPGQTDLQQLFTLKTVHCMGCCALAPVVKIDDRYYSNPTKTQLEGIVESCKQEREPSCQG